MERKLTDAPAESEAQTPTVDSVGAALGFTDFATGETAPFTRSYGSGAFEGMRAQIYNFPGAENPTSGTRRSVCVWQ